MPHVLMVIGVWIVSSALAKIFLVTGLGVFSYHYVSDFVSDARAEVIANYNSLPADVIAVISLAGIPEGLSVLLSSLTIAGTIKAAKVFLGMSS